MTYFVMALALVLGFTQCKKEQVATTENEGEKVTITLKLDNSSRGHINPHSQTVDVVYDDGDVIMVGLDGNYIGDLSTNDGVTFTNSFTISGTPEKIHFYYLNGKSQTVSDGKCTVDISDQSSSLPVISYACVDYKSDNNYIVKMLNQCALVKFDYSGSSVTLMGMMNKATIDFATNTVTSGKTGDGDIKTNVFDAMTHYAIVLSDQEAVTNGNLDGGGKFSIPSASPNAFLIGTINP
jgi:hypothetical protein